MRFSLRWGVPFAIVAGLAPLLAAVGADPPQVVFREPCDNAPVLAFWTGDKPTESQTALGKTDPAPAEGAAYTKLSTTWGEGGPAYSYWNVTTFQPFELLKGVKYTFRGKVYAPGGEIQPKVRFDLPRAKVDPIWHGATVVKGDGWVEFTIPDLRGIAEALAVRDKWDTDTVTLATIFFNIGGKPKVFAVDDLQILAEGTPLPQLVRKPGADYVLPADFPLLRIRATGDCSSLKAFSRAADGKEQPLLDGALYGEAAKSDGEHALYARVDTLPREVVLRTAPGATAGVTGVSLVLPGGREVAPTGGAPGPLGAGDLLFTFDPNAAGPLPKRKLPPIRVGVYFAPYAISDPGHLPSTAWGYTPRAEIFAPFDFSVIQTQTAGSGMVPTREFCAKLKEINPAHRIILRLAPILGAAPKYFFEPFYRRGLLEHYSELIATAGPENVYAVTIGEEENGNLMSGLWWRDTPPDWIEAYRVPFERETGEKLTWANAVSGNGPFLQWMRPKIRFYYNDLYTQLKARFPGIKVLQYIAIAGDGSDISWHEPGEILADGWVYWSFHFKQQLTLVDCRLPGGEVVPVTMWLDGTFRNLLRIRNSGLPNEEIYHCGFAHYDPGKFYEVPEQLQMLRDLGFRNSFAFYPTGAFLRPEDCRDPAKVGEIDQDPYRLWRGRLESARAYQREMAAGE